MVHGQQPDSREPVSIEQLVSSSTLEDPRVSPDGKTIAFTVSPASKEGEHRVSTIWLVPFHEGDATQFTSGLWNDRSPRWSPDGSRLAFLSDRAERGEMSLYVAHLQGGEAVRVLEQQGKLSDLQWSPCGSRITLLITDPETDEEKKRKEERDDANVWDINYKFQRLWSVDPVTKETVPLSPEGVQVWSYAWAPDGSKLALNTSKTPRYNDTLNETTVTVITPSGDDTGESFTLLGTADDMVWSADGTKLAYRWASGKAVTGDSVYCRTMSSGDTVELTPCYPGSAEHLAPVQAGEALLFKGVESINSVLYRLEWDGRRTRLLNADQAGYLDETVSVDASGTHVAGIWQNMTSPPEVAAIADGRVTRRTSFNEALACASTGEPELVRWTSDEGVEIEGVLWKPAGYVEGTRYPLVVSVHGGPTWLWANVFHASWHDWGAVLASRGIAVLLPNPRGSTGRGSEFLNALFNEVGMNEYRDMIAGVDAMVERGIADPDRLGIGGWSWGGYMTAWAITQTDRFKAAIVGAGLPNMITDNSLGDIPSANLSYFDHSPYHDPVTYFERSAIRHISKVTTPTLVLHGEADTRVATAQGIEMYVALQQVGVESQLVTYPREGHAIHERKHQEDLLKRVIDWYERFLLQSTG